jgi:hypothetical protein
MLDADGFRFFGDRILNRLDLHADGIANFHGAIAALDVERERDVLRFENFGKSRHEDFEGQSASLAAADLQERIALRRRRAFVEEQAARAIAFVNGFGPARDEPHGEAIQIHLAKVAAMDVPGSHTFAETSRGRRAEFARTTVITTASLKVISFDAPSGFGRCAHKFSVKGGIHLFRGYK